MDYWSKVTASHGCVLRGKGGSWLRFCGDISLLLALTEGLAHQRLPTVSSFSHPPELPFEKISEHYQFLSLWPTHTYSPLLFRVENLKKNVFGPEVLTFHSLLITGAKRSRWTELQVRFLSPGASPEARGGLLRSWTWLSPKSMLSPWTVWRCY